MLTMSQNKAYEIVVFNSVKPGMELQCTYRINTKKNGNDETGKYIRFSGPVIQKTEHLIYVRDKSTNRVHSISLADYICGSGTFKITKK